MNSATWDYLGSSPLARGARGISIYGCNHVGIIPARAGSTSRRTRQHPFPRDHPRSRGEHDSIPARLSNGEGSSPLARGAHAAGTAGYGSSGIIPARAGSTPAHRFPRWVEGDHPRSRGEHLLTATIRAAQ